MSYKGSIGRGILQNQESGKNDHELPALRVAGANSMSRKHQNSLIALSIIAACSLSLASAQETNNSKPEQAPATPKTVVNATPAAAQTVRTPSGIVRGVTEGNVSSFKG